MGNVKVMEFREFGNGWWDCNDEIEVVIELEEVEVVNTISVT